MPIERQQEQKRHLMFHNLKKELKNKTSDKKRIPISSVFWIKDETMHQREFEKTGGNCCYNHQIGLPINKITQQPMPLFDYELDIIENIENHKDYALVKARGIGATELILRWILFRAIINTIPGRKFLIITGLKMELAQDYMKRIANLCKNLYVKQKSQTTILVG